MRRWLAGFNAAMVAFMLAPLLMIVLMSFTPAGGFELPGWHWSLRWYRAVFAYPGFIDAFFLSLRLGLATATLATALAFGAVWTLQRRLVPGVTLLDSFFMSPLLVPAVVFGVAMLQFLNRHGLYNSFIGLLLAHVIVVLPFVVRVIAAALRDVPRQLEWVALSLGANMPRALLLVTLPLSLRGVVAGFLFAFIVSFDEVTVTLFITGPAYQTLPVRLYNYLTDQVDPTAAAVSAMLIFLSLCLILALDRLGGFKTMRR
ncbi:MAG TPA: ABC transporter permease [Acetobacteraceae bacterium]